MHKYVFPFGTQVGRVCDVTNGVVTMLAGSIDTFTVVGLDETKYGATYADGSKHALGSDELKAEISIFKNANKLLNPDN